MPAERPGGVDVHNWWILEAKASRERLRLSQEEIAKRLKVDQSKVSRCLRGKGATIPMLEAISAELQIPPPVFSTKSMWREQR